MWAETPQVLAVLRYAYMLPEPYTVPVCRDCRREHESSTLSARLEGKLVRPICRRLIWPRTCKRAHKSLFR